MPESLLETGGGKCGSQLARRENGVESPTFLLIPDRSRGCCWRGAWAIQAAFNQLVPFVHAELHRIARRCMAGERASHSLQATALVDDGVQVPDRDAAGPVAGKNSAHYLGHGSPTRMMRRVLVDVARAKGYQKRGGGAVRVTFDELALAAG